MVILKENYKGDLYMKANKIILPIIIFFNSLVMMDNTNKKPKALEILQGPMFNNIIIPNLTKKMNNPARPANEKKKIEELLTKYRSLRNELNIITTYIRELRELMGKE